MTEDPLSLLHGPYLAPRCRVGETLRDERHGRQVVVGGFHDGPIPWPFIRRRGRHRLILTGDLVRAVKTEAEVAVAHHWGVDVTTVWKWRRALGVPKANEGSARLYRDGMAQKVTAEDRAANGKAIWSAEDVALLGTVPDAVVAERTGRAVKTVRKQRLRLGIPPRKKGRET